MLKSFLLAIWPVEKKETKRVLSLFVLLFLLCSCYSVLRNVKDTLILTADGSSAEVIPFIKVWGVLPGAFFGTWLYTKIRCRFSQLKTAQILISGFLLYFLFFSFVLFPFKELFYLDSLDSFLRTYLPQGAGGFIAMVCNWLFSSFYVISELWSVLILLIVFWGFTNDITQVSEAKRFYGILNVGSNLAPILAGGSAIAVARYFPLPVFAGSDPMQEMLCKISILVAILGFTAVFLFHWIYKKTLSAEMREKVGSGDVASIGKKKKKRLSLSESIKVLAGSKYLISIAVMVLSFNIAINLTDVLWKNQLKIFFKDPADMLHHLNQITVGIGIVGTFGGMLFSSMIKKRGWTFVALATPLLMTLLGIAFFSFLFYGDILTGIVPFIAGITPLAATVYLGSFQNCMSKAVKYSLFDSTKEMAFLPLSQEDKTRGKSAIDGLGSGMGKSGSSLIYQFFILTFGSIGLSMPYIAGFLLLVFGAWISAVFYVGKRFGQATLNTVQEAPLPVKT